MRPKVLHTIETAEPGGAETILVQIAECLSNRYEPMGLVLSEGWTSNELRKRNITVFHEPLHRSFDLGWVKRLLKIIKDNDIKLIHSHEFTTNAYLTVAARITNIPIICTVHGKNYYPERYYRRLAYRLVAKHADKFVAVSYDLKNYLAYDIGIPEDRIRVVHNGIDVNLFSNDKTGKSDIKSDLAISDSDYVIIVVAALFEMKGHKDLLESIGNLGEDAKDVKVLFVGDGWYKPELIRKTKELGIEDKVEFLGFRNNIAELLSISKLFILPSYSEGLPVSVLEAMSSELPVIATDVGGMREVIKDGENGYLIPPGNPQVLADRVRYCIHNELLAKELSKKGRPFVVDKFSLDTMLGNYESMYENLLNIN